MKKIFLVCAGIVLVAGVGFGVWYWLTPHMKVLAGKMSISFDKAENYCIYPAKVVITNLRQGKVCEFDVTVYNEKKRDVVFLVGERFPDFVEEGYERLGDSNIRIGISCNELTIQSGAIGVFHVEVGRDEKRSENKEAWISVKEQGAGTIISELCVRCLIKGNK